MKVPVRPVVPFDIETPMMLECLRRMRAECGSENQPVSEALAWWVNRDPAKLQAWLYLMDAALVPDVRRNGHGPGKVPEHFVGYGILRCDPDGDWWAEAGVLPGVDRAILAAIAHHLRELRPEAFD